MNKALCGADDIDFGKSEPLYAARVKIHPQDVKGTFRRLKWTGLVVLLGIYYLVPWFRWERGAGLPDQAVLVDMAGRRLFFFEIEIWPQEIYYLTGLLVLGAVGLFLVTALAGRVWCGFFCPQTVWTDLFMYVERLVEGNRNKRIRLDAAPLSLDKAWRRVAKHAIWLAVSLATGGAWILYFADAPTVMVELFTGQASVAVYGFTLLFTSTTYVLGALAREQVCLYMCPWPRFQGAMFDEDTLLVTYEGWRGEPRGKAKRKGIDTLAGELGDCVDCNLCVKVCPTGIDIRNGSQMQCIGCALCVDACNTIMGKMGRPANLIAYDSIANMQARAAGRPTRNRVVRPRTIAYTVLLALVAGLMTYGLMFRSALDVNVQRDRSPLFVRLSDGGIRNGYTVKILNKEREARTFRLRVDGLKDASLTVIGVTKDAGYADLRVKGDAVGSFRLFVRVPQGSLKQESTEIDLFITDLASGEDSVQDTFFYGPET